MADCIANSPGLWRDLLPYPKGDCHKYSRGHLLVYAAPDLMGATRLAASAAARMGSGLVSVLAPDRRCGDIYRAALPAHIIVRDDLTYHDTRVTACLYGCGGLPCSIDVKTSVATIIDADGLFALPEKLHKNIILTPHEGEFKRIFPDFTENKDENAQKAAQKLGCIVVLKGEATILAHPDGRLVESTHASPYLASAGTGDVLAGMIAGLCAQGVEPYLAACMAVWMHGEAGIRIGPGLVASDISDILPQILRDFA